MVGNGTLPRGFTIVEVLLVIAVTGVLLGVAILFVGGKQSKTEFQQAIQLAQSQIQQNINDVINGFYPNGNDFSCSISGGALTLTNAFAQSRGTNSGCVFLGKALRYSDPSSTNPQQVYIYTIVAKQCASNSTSVCLPPATILDETPLAVSPSSTNMNPPPASEVQLVVLENNLHLCKNPCIAINADGKPVGAFAFLSGPTQYSGNSPLSGSQRFSTYPVPGSSLANGTPGAISSGADEIDSTQPSKGLINATPVSTIQLCLASGTTNESGRIDIANNRNQLVTNLTIFENNTTCT